MSLQNPIINNEKLSRFETEINGEFAYVNYSFFTSVCFRSGSNKMYNVQWTMDNVNLREIIYNPETSGDN